MFRKYLLDYTNKKYVHTIFGQVSSACKKLINKSRKEIMQHLSLVAIVNLIVVLHELTVYELFPPFIKSWKRRRRSKKQELIELACI